MSEDRKPRNHADWLALKEAERKGYEPAGTYEKLRKEEEVWLAKTKKK